MALLNESVRVHDLEARVAQLESRLQASEALCEQLRAELAAEHLRAHEEQQGYQVLVEHMPALIYRFSVGGGNQNLYLSPHLEPLLGYTPQEWLATGQEWRARVHPDDLPEVLRQFELTLASGRAVTREYRMRHRAGRYLWVKDTLMAFYGPDGRTVVQGFVVAVDKRRQAEQALQKSEERLRTVLTGMPVMLDAFDDQLRLAVWNEECERVTGYSAEEVLGRTDLIALLYPDQRPREEMIRQWVPERGDFRNWEITLTRKDGARRTIAWSNVANQLPIPGWSFWAVGVDVTEQRAAEAALRASETRLRMAIEVGNMMAFELELPTRKLQWGAVSPFLRPPEGVDLPNTLEAAHVGIHPDDLAFVQHCWEEAILGQKGLSFEARFLYTDGTCHWILCQASFVGGAGGEPDRIVGLLTDISERKWLEEGLQALNVDLERRVQERTQELEQTNLALRQEIVERTRVENALRESQRFIERVLAASPASVYVFDYRAKRLIYSNKLLATLLELTPEEQRVVGDYPLEQLMHPEDAARLPELYSAYDRLADDAVVENEFRLRHMNDSWRWFGSRNIVFMRGPDGRPTQILGTSIDITARKEAEARLAATFRRLEELNADLQRGSNLLNTIINSLSDGLVLLDAEALVLLANRGLTTLYDCEVSQVVGQRWAELCPVTMPYVTQALTTGAHVVGREETVRPDQKIMSLDIQAFPLHSPEGAVDQVVLHLVDVTERLQHHKLLLQNERLMARSRLAAVVAHEVNSPLQAIQNLLFLAASDDAAERDGYLSMISDEIDRIGGLIRRLLDIHRPGDTEMRQVEIRPLLEKLLLLTGSTLARHQVQVTTQLNVDGLLVFGRSDQLTQVFLNLILNAIDAMPRGGELTLRSNTRPSLPSDGLQPPLPQRVVEVEIADTGHGLSEEALAHAFEPFFTTKQQGSGLGLSISSQIAEQYGGRLLARNGERGAVFTVILPAVTAKAERRQR